MTLDARKQWTPERAAELIDEAQCLVGSRNRLCEAIGISRRRLGYIEAGFRLLPDGRKTPVVMTFAEQVVLEDTIAWHRANPA